ncbi:hypothetical protein H4582DRAFT_1599183 [Lactarius indigo]|nr:hypothetical protein H4582DRAFT_1599183 [Lactarius indigo]
MVSKISVYSSSPARFICHDTCCRVDPKDAMSEDIRHPPLLHRGRDSVSGRHISPLQQDIAPPPPFKHHPSSTPKIYTSPALRLVPLCPVDDVPSARLLWYKGKGRGGTATGSRQIDIAWWKRVRESTGDAELIKRTWMWCCADPHGSRRRVGGCLAWDVCDSPLIAVGACFRILVSHLRFSCLRFQVFFDQHLS